MVRRIQMRLSQNQREESIGRWYGSIRSHELELEALLQEQIQSAVGGGDHEIHQDEHPIAMESSGFYQRRAGASPSTWRISPLT